MVTVLVGLSIGVGKNIKLYHHQIYAKLPSLNPFPFPYIYMELLRRKDNEIDVSVNIQNNRKEPKRQLSPTPSEKVLNYSSQHLALIGFFL